MLCSIPIEFFYGTVCKFGDINSPAFQEICHTKRLLDQEIKSLHEKIIMLKSVYDLTMAGLNEHMMDESCDGKPDKYARKIHFVKLQYQFNHELCCLNINLIKTTDSFGLSDAYCSSYRVEKRYLEVKLIAVEKKLDYLNRKIY